MENKGATDKRCGECWKIISLFDAHSYPNTPRYQLPEKDKQTIKPVDGDDWLASLKSIHYADGNFSCVELHGEIAALNQWGLDKSGSYVSDVDIAYVPDTRQLA